MTPPIRQNPYSLNNLASSAWTGVTKRADAARVSAGRTWDYFNGKGAPADFDKPAPPEVQAKLATPGSVVRGLIKESGDISIPVGVGLGRWHGIPYPDVRWHTISTLPTQVAKIAGFLGLSITIGAYELTAKTQNFADFWGKVADFLTFGLTKDMSVDSDIANDLAFATMVAAGVFMFGKDLRGWMVKDRSDLKDLPIARTVAWTALYSALWLMMVRYPAETTGINGLLSDGSFNIFANVIDKITADYATFSHNLYAGYWSSFIAGALIASFGLSIAGSIPQIAYTGLGVFTHSYNTLIGNDPGKSLIKYVPDDAQELWIMSEDKDSGDEDGYLEEAIMPKAAHERVLGEIQAFTPEVKAAIARGELPLATYNGQFWRLAFSIAGAVLAKEGIDAASVLASGTSIDPTLDAATATLGLGIGAGLLVNTVKPGSVPGIAQFVSTWSHLFNAQRIPYALVFVLIHGSFTGAVDNLSSFLQGLKNVDNYYFKMFFRGFYAPTLNRVILNFRQAMGQLRISKFSYFLPGYILMLGFIKAQAETSQAVMQLYQEAAIAYVNADRPETRAEHLDELKFYRTLVDECLDNDGYGRDDALKVATETWEFMNKTNAELNIVDFQ